MEQKQLSTSDKPHLYYWVIRGLGSYIRLAFEAAGVTDYLTTDYKEDEEWFGRDKPQLGMTLPNLPYLKDGDLYISEHDAIFRHVLRKYKPEMLGVGLDEQAEVD